MNNKNFLDEILKRKKENGSANPIMKKMINEKNELKEIPLISLKENPYQPRIEIKPEEIKDLANSIKEKGLLQPILVAKADKGYYIVAGHRRTEAYRLLGKEKIKARVIKASEEDLASLSLIENLQRENLDLIETAMALKRYKEKFNKTDEEIAKEIGKSRSAVTQMINVLNLPDKIIKDVKENKSTKDVTALNILNSYYKKIQKLNVSKLTNSQNPHKIDISKDTKSQIWENEVFELYQGFLKNGREWLKKEIEKRLSEIEYKQQKELVTIKQTKKHGISIKVNLKLNDFKLKDFEKELKELVNKYSNY